MPVPRPDQPRRYVMLMTSLPHLGTPFRRDRTPMSRTRLDRRLALLHPDDHATLAAVERLVQWEAIEQDRDDAAMLEEARALDTALRAAGLIDLAETLTCRLRMRALVAALRWRHLGQDGPGTEAWATGPFARLAEAWDQPDLGQRHRFSWAEEAAHLLDAGDAPGLERLLLDAAWRDLDRRVPRHAFDFTAVVLYVLRWDITDRWTRMSSEKAAARFDRLVRSSLAGLDPLPAGDAAHG